MIESRVGLLRLNGSGVPLERDSDNDAPLSLLGSRRSVLYICVADRASIGVVPWLPYKFVISSTTSTRPAFYCDHLGFHKDMHPAPAFAMLSRGDLRLLLSAPGAGPGGGGQAMPDGRMPEPGGWNRFSLEVPDLAATVEGLR